MIQPQRLTAAFASLLAAFVFLNAIPSQVAAQASDPKEQALAYIDLLAAGKFDEASKTFDAAMAKAMPAAKLAETWKSLEAAHGKLKSRSVLTTEKVKQKGVEYTAVVVACEFEKTPMESRLVYAPDGKLSGMFTRPGKLRFVGGEELWLGELNAGVAKLRILIHLGKNADKKEIASFDSLDQGQKGLNFDSVAVDGRKVKLESKQLGVVYEGEFDEGHKELKGKWKQGFAALTLDLKKVDVEPEAKRPQTPKGPFPYESQEVTYDSLAEGVKLAGTLTLPKGNGPFPAVLLITGSGAQDRDETIFAHKPFFVIADDLTRRGIAVLRVDDRGVGGSSGPADATSADFAQDVKAGVAFLKSRPQIDPRKIGLIGHSEGGIIALMVAAENRDVAFVVLMAGSALTGEKILYGQGEALLKAAGASAADIGAQRKIQERLFAIVASTSDNAAAQKAMQAAVEELAKSLDEEARKVLEENKAATAGQLSMLTSKWFRFFLDYDPAKAAEKVTCPLLALNGEKDLQVLYKENLAALEAALKKAGNSDFQTRSFPNLNHLFQTCDTGQVSEYGRIEETIAPQVLEEIGAWIEKRVK